MELGNLQVVYKRADFHLGEDQVDILAVGAHPDDVEMCVGGILIKSRMKGYRTAILDLTAGEKGTRGTAQDRLREAECSARKLDLCIRLNLGLPDALFDVNMQAAVRVAGVYRLLKPSVLLLNAPEERHPDHEKACDICRSAVFISGLRRIEIRWDGKSLSPYKPRAYFFYIQFIPLEPTFLVDISDVWDKKIEALKCYRSQFDPDYDPAHRTILSAPDFWDKFSARFRQWGALIGVDYAEGLISPVAPGIQDIMGLFFQT